MHLFWQNCDATDCIRQYIGLGFDIVAFIFALFATIRIALTYHKLRFELMPLILNTTTIGIIFFLSLASQNYEYNLVVLTLELYTYFFFTFAFGTLLSRLSNRLANGVFVLITILIVTAIILILTFADEIECDAKLGLIFFFIELIEYAVTFYLCARLKTRLRDTYKKENRLTSSFLDGVLGVEDQYVQLRVKQVNLLLIGFTISIIAGVIEIIYINVSNQQIVCVKDGVSYLRANTVLGSIALYVEQVAQLVPHICIPVILYVLPTWKTGVKLGVSKIDEEKYRERQNSVQKEYNNEKGLRDYYSKMSSPENSPLARPTRQLHD